MEITGILLDVTGIQGYVFGSSKLKENLGASFLVKNVYNKDFLREVAESVVGDKKELDRWQDEKESATLYITKPNIEMEVGYIGGGNALLFFRDQAKANDFVSKWSKRLLFDAPGLSASVAMRKIELDSPQQGVTDIFKELNKNKFTHHPQVTLPRHGITTECPRTGLSAEYEPDAEDEDERFISSVAASKLNHEKLAHEMFKETFKDVLNDYNFPKDLEKLGQSKGESHIAIVHIDGNGMGQRFMGCGTIEDLRKLSVSVSEATEESMKSLLKEIRVDYDYYQNPKNFKLEPKTFPIRPIILGGDDVTFVTDARLGVYFAEKFIEAFVEQKVSDDKPLSACAGVAITKTKYPFYRGYKLAEQLCHSAKEKAKEGKDESWLDFHIAYGGFSGELSEIRRRHYTVKTGDLCYRPYRICPEKQDAQSFSEFKKGMKELDDKWPRNKQKELREVLSLGEEATKQFIKEMENRGNSLPNIPGHHSFKNSGWDGKKTPYFDMLELMELYCPPEKIKEESQ